MSVSPNLVAVSDMFLSSKTKRQPPMWCSPGCASDIKLRPLWLLSFPTKHFPFTKNQERLRPCLCFQNIHQDSPCFPLRKITLNQLCGVLRALVSIRSYHPASCCIHQRRFRRLPKLRFDTTMLALLKMTNHHVMCSFLREA